MVSLGSCRPSVHEDYTNHSQMPCVVRNGHGVARIPVHDPEVLAQFVLRAMSQYQDRINRESDLPALHHGLPLENNQHTSNIG